MAFTLWLQGYADQALTKMGEALSLARMLQNPFNLVFTLGYATYFHQSRRELQAATDLSEEAIALATDREFAFFAAAAHIVRGWTRVESGQTEEGLAQMHRGLQDYQSTRAELLWPYLQNLLVEGYRHTREIDKGLAVLRQAMQRVQQTSERWSEAELYRLEGELLLRQPEPDEEHAVNSYSRALTIARQQGAKALELRAAVGLGRLWQRQGLKEQADNLVQPLYESFTEGHDTPDLQDAKTFLQR